MGQRQTTSEVSTWQQQLLFTALAAGLPGGASHQYAGFGSYAVLRGENCRHGWGRCPVTANLRMLRFSDERLWQNTLRQNLERVAPQWLDDRWASKYLKPVEISCWQASNNYVSGEVVVPIDFSRDSFE